MDLSAQAAQSAKEGQQLYNQFRGTEAQNKSSYGTYQSEASNANKQLQSEAAYMKGAGSGANVYNQQLAKQEQATGYNPEQLQAANKSLFSLTGAMNAANRQFSTPGGVGAYGMSAPALASYEGSILTPLTTGVANANTQVGALNQELGTIQTGAGQATTAQVQSEQQTANALSEAVKNYTGLANQALSNMQFYGNLAAQQGSLNAQEQQSYAAAQQAYTQISQIIQHTKLLLAQTTNQNLINQGIRNQLKTPSAPTPNAGIKIQGGGNTGVNIQGGGNTGVNIQGGGSRVQGSSIPIQIGGGGIQGGGISLQ